MRPRHIRVGPVAVFWWSGAWSLPQTFPCEKCRNLYFGPFGIEIDRLEPVPNHEEENENPWP